MRLYGRRQGLSDKMKEELAPDRQFAERAKKEFLAFFDMKQSSRPAGAVFLSGSERGTGGWGRFKAAWWGAGAVVAGLGLVAATSAFADVANVAPSNPLYPLKRLAEDTQLIFAASAQKPALELAFAARRAEEISALASQPDAAVHAALIKNLTGDMNDEVSSSFAAAVGIHAKGDTLAGFCGTLASAVTSSTGTAQGAAVRVSLGPLSISIGDQLAAHPEFAARAAEECGLALPTSTQEDTVAAASSTVAAETQQGDQGGLHGSGGSDAQGQVRGARTDRGAGDGDGDYGGSTLPTSTIMVATTTPSGTWEIGVSAPSVPAFHGDATSDTNEKTASPSSTTTTSVPAGVTTPLPAVLQTLPIVTNTGGSGGSGDNGGSGSGSTSGGSGAGDGASVGSGGGAGISLPSLSL